MDFVCDPLADGRIFGMLVMMDMHRRECLALEVDSSMGGSWVARVLEQLKEQRGVPRAVGTDNGPEFRNRPIDEWAYESEEKLHCIKPSTPMQNALIESMNAQIR